MVSGARPLKRSSIGSGNRVDVRLDRGNNRSSCVKLPSKFPDFRSHPQWRWVIPKDPQSKDSGSLRIGSKKGIDMEGKIGFERWKKCKPVFKTGWRRQEVMMVLVLSSLLFFPLSWIQGRDLDQDEKSVESKEQQSQQTKSGQLKKYEEVIHSGAKSIPGLFTVHRIDDKVYYEIPSSVLNRDMLWYIEVAKSPTNIGYGAQPIGDRTIRWERRGTTFCSVTFHTINGQRNLGRCRGLSNFLLWPRLSSGSVY